MRRGYSPLPQGGAGEDIRLFVQDAQPDSGDVLEGYLWSDTASNILFRATAPSTWVSTEGGSAAHTLDSPSHPDVPPITEAKGMILVWDSVAGAWKPLAVGTNGQVIVADSTLDLGVKYGDAGVGDVSAAEVIGDNELVRGDGGSKGVQDSPGVTLDDSGNMSGVTMDSFDNEIDADRMHIQVRNESGGTLTKGTPIYISGYNVGLNIILVDKADSDGSGTMPAIGLMEEDLANNISGECVLEGRISGIDTSSFSAGDILYISTTAGVLTTTKPTGASELIQSIGGVLRSHATLGIIVVGGAGRTNDVPNTVFPVDDATSDPLIDADSAADGTEDSFSRKDHVHPKHHAQAHTVESHSGTTGTGAELNTLTDKSDADALHNHGEANKVGLDIESPTTSDDIKITFFDRAVTITKVVLTVVGSGTPSCTVDLRHHTDRSNVGNALITTPTASTEAGNNAESTGHIIASFDDATIPLDSHLWLEIDAVGGTVDIVEVTVYYTVD